MVTSIEMQQITEKARELSREGWRKVRFGDVTRNIQVNVNAQTSGLERYVAGEHMETDNLHIKHWGIIGEDYLGPAFHQKFVKGQILYGSRRTYLRKVAVADFDGICANTTFVLEAKKDEILPELLPFIMQSEGFTLHSIKQSRGSVNPYVNWKDIEWYEFMLPPKDEQRRIADILWAADEAFEKYQKTLEMIKINKKFQVENIYISSYTTFADLGSYTNLITSGSRGWAKYFAPEGCIFLRVTNLSRKTTEINMKDLEFVSLPHEVEGKRTQVMEGDLLISITADLGRIAIVPSDFPESYVNQHVALVRLNLEMVNPYFVAYYFLTSEGQKQFQKFNDAGTKAGLNLQSVRNLRIPCLPLSEQNRIVQSLRIFDAYIFDIEEHLKKLKCLRKNLLSLTELDLNGQFIK